MSSPSISPTGQLTIRLPQAGPVALLLDDVLVQVVQAAPLATFDLPAGRLHRSAELISLPDGQRLADASAALAAAYAIEIGELAVDGAAVTGGFSGVAWLAPTLGVDLIGESGCAGRGVASRGADGAWRFAVALASLLPLDRQVELRLRIGGMDFAEPAVTMSAAAIGMAGHLDVAASGRVEGWAVDLARPDAKPELDIWLNGHVVAETVADRPRDDLAALGHGAGGFSVALPAAPGAEIRVRLKGLPTELAGSPRVVAAEGGVIGCFDIFHGMSAHGWALDTARPEQPLLVEIVGPDGAVLARGRANLFRGDLLDAELNRGLCAFKIDLAAHVERLLGHEITARIAGGGPALPGSPHCVTANPNLMRFLRRRQSLRAGVLPRLRRALNYRAGGQALSIIMPVHETPRAMLIEALESVRTQWCGNWELVCVDDGSLAPHVGELLAIYAARDSRIRVLRSTENVGIARAVNFALRAAKHEYVAFLDHDDALEPDAVWQMLRAIARTDADLLYSDEAQTDEHLGNITEFRLRPAFSHDYYLSHPYFVHLICARAATVRAIGGWDEGMAISADVDFVLRMIEAARSVAHVPAVLYRWRTHGASTGHAKQEAVTQATLGALQRHLDRTGTGATAREGVWFNQYRIDWPRPAGRVLIVIPTKNKGDLLRTAIKSIERTAGDVDYRICVIDHQSTEAATSRYLRQLAKRHVVMPYEGEFNFSRMNNVAVAAHGGDCEFVLFLNNDIEATAPGWLARMVALAGRAEVGAVGALLMYADRRVQHAGVILGFNDSAEHALKFQEVFLDDKGRRNLGYNCALSSTRDYSAVTAACMMLRRSVFEQVGGFDESFGIGFNDTDLCLRLRAAGYKVLYDGQSVLYHYESATRSDTRQVFHPEDTQRLLDRWAGLLHDGDPCYHPNLSRRTQDHVPVEDASCRIVNPPRLTRLRA